MAQIAQGIFDKLVLANVRGVRQFEDGTVQFSQYSAGLSLEPLFNQYGASIINFWTDTEEHCTYWNVRGGSFLIAALQILMGTVHD